MGLAASYDQLKRWELGRPRLWRGDQARRADGGHSQQPRLFLPAAGRYPPRQPGPYERSREGSGKRAIQNNLKLWTSVRASGGLITKKQSRTGPGLPAASCAGCRCRSPGSFPRSALPSSGGSAAPPIGRARAPSSGRSRPSIGSGKADGRISGRSRFSLCRGDAFQLRRLPPPCSGRRSDSRPNSPYAELGPCGSPKLPWSSLPAAATSLRLVLCGAIEPRIHRDRAETLRCPISRNKDAAVAALAGGSRLDA